MTDEKGEVQDLKIHGYHEQDIPCCEACSIRSYDHDGGIYCRLGYHHKYRQHHFIFFNISPIGICDEYEKGDES